MQSDAETPVSMSPDDGGKNEFPESDVATVISADADVIENSSLPTEEAVAVIGDNEVPDVATVPSPGSRRRSFERTYAATALPQGTSLHHVQLKGDVLTLETRGDGSYEEEGYIDIPLSVKMTGRLLQIEADHVNLIRDGGFTSVTAATAYLAPSTCGACTRGDKKIGEWLTTGTTASILPTFESDSDDADDAAVKLRRLVDVSQIVPMVAGKTYTLNWDADLNHVITDYLDSEDGSIDSQGLIVSLRFLDADLNTATLFNPATNATETGRMLETYYSSSGERRMHLKIRAPDCATHLQYMAGTGTYDKDVSFNLCTDRDGNALSVTSDDGTVSAAYSEEDLRYMSVIFATNWFGRNTSPSNASDYYASVDNVTLYRDDEIEVAVLDDFGNILQSSTIEEGFRLLKNRDAKTLRIYLRASDPEQSPTLHSVAFKSGWDLNVSVGAKMGSFTEGRLGAMNLVGPMSDYENEDLPLRALCEDPLAGDEIACLELNDRYDLNVLRAGLSPLYMRADLNADGTDYDFSLTKDGELTLSRLLEVVTDGDDILALLVKDGATYYDDPSDGKSWAVITYFNDIPDPSGERDATEQAYHLMEQYTRFWTGMFNGETIYTYRYINSGASVDLPRVRRWEMFNEDNINGTEWLGLASWDHTDDASERLAIAATMADLAEELATIIKEAIPDAVIATTGLAAYSDMFDTEYLADYFSTLDPTLFDMTNFHPYYTTYDAATRAEDLEDEIASQWQRAVSTLATYGFDDKPSIFTEYGYTHQIYDPGCEADASKGTYQPSSGINEEWDQGFGEGEFAKLTIRQTLSLLSLPAMRIKPYGVHNYENESSGYRAEADGSGGYECWRSDPLYNFNLFDRVAGTGILSGKDEPTRYTTNAAGTAYLTVAKYLSVSSPMETSVLSAEPVASSENDHYRAQVYAVGQNAYVLAVWWYQDYTYGNVADWMSYVSGANENGFADERLFDVTISGIDSVSSAKLVRLDGTAVEQKLKIKRGAAGLTIPAVPVGEMPSLVLLGDE